MLALKVHFSSSDNDLNIMPPHGHAFEKTCGANSVPVAWLNVPLSSPDTLSFRKI